MLTFGGVSFDHHKETFAACPRVAASFFQRNHKTKAEEGVIYFGQTLYHQFTTLMLSQEAKLDS